MESDISSILPSGKMFLATNSQLHERYDPYYIYHKLNTSLESKYKSERLSSLVNTFSGGTPSKSNTSYWDGDIPWISPKDFNGFNLFETEDKITEEGVKNSSTKVAPKNSVIIVVRSGVLAHTFPVCINQVPAAINQDLKVLTPTTEKLLPEFLGYYFFTFGEKLLPLVTKHGTTVHSINTEQFERLQIPVPPIDIQEKVISIYQEHFETKAQKEAKAKELLNSIDDYLLSELGIEVPKKDNSLENRIFKASLKNLAGVRFDPDYHSKFYRDLQKEIEKSTFDLKPLGNLSEFIKGGKTPASSKYSDKPTDYPIVKVGSYTNDYIDLNKVGYIKSSNNSTPVQKGDIFILSAAHQAEYVGKSIKILTEEPPVETAYVGELINLRTNKHVANPLYIFSVLSLEIFKTLINREKTGQTSHVYGKDLEHINIPAPSLEKQNEIASHIRSKQKKAKQLKEEGEQAVEEARQQVEEMILEEDSVSA
jgi:restriction endonuclease S subunit